MPDSPSQWFTVPIKYDRCGETEEVLVCRGRHLINVSGLAISLNICVEAVNTSDPMKYVPSK